MKCKYCNADIEKDAQFCTNCGKDLSKFERCVNCGELLDRDTVFCPYCGTEQSKKDEVNEQNEQKDSMQESKPEVVDDILQHDEEKSSKKWVWIVLSLILLAAIIGSGYYFYDMNSGNKMLVEEPDSTKIEVVDSTGIAPDAAKGFIESMYKNFYDPYNNERTDKKLLSKYFTEEAMQKFYVESDYDEGAFFYCTDFLVNGSISGAASPDYGDKVVSRTIKPESDDWFLVTNIWDVIKEPVKVRMQVKLIDGAYKIVDIDADEDEESTVNAEEGIITIEEAYRIYGEMIVEDGEFKGFRSIDNVNNIMGKYGYKTEKKYFVSYNWDFSPLFYKNCIFAQSVKNDNGFVDYVDVPTPRGEGVASFVGIDNVTCSVVISPFTKATFDDYLKQIENSGAKMIKKDESVIEYKYLYLDISAHISGLNCISYCIVISKE